MAELYATVNGEAARRCFSCGALCRDYAELSCPLCGCRLAEVPRPRPASPALIGEALKAALIDFASSDSATVTRADEHDEISVTLTRRRR